ncbi:MAG: hypothetical protein NW203_15830 [Hyphomonadaceae bacterium]|nr:hypothetical protein [Hyphomonadaceae bacterium]
MTMTEQSAGGPRASSGNLGAALVYGLYLLSIPSAAAFALVGVILAYVMRSEATGLARSHIEGQIKLWWTAVWWAIGLGLLTIVAWIFNVTIIGLIIGIPLLGLIGIVGFVVFLWFTVMSGWGLLKLMNGEPR